VDPACPVPLLDPVKLRQVLYNYVSNALKFSPEGSAVLVSVMAEADDSELRIAVSDQGCGIAQEHLASLFSEFRQFNGGAHQGSGLGLAVTRRLVEAQGGTVGVHSVPDQGSTFYALLPLRTAVASGVGSD